MVSLNKSFLYGICFASLTWMISLYLYFQISNSDANGWGYLTTPQEKSTSFPWVNSNFGFFRQTTNFNSDKLLEKLKPFISTPISENKFEQELMDLGMVKNEEDKEIRETGYKIHAYNVLISNRLGLNRSIPDTRNSLCANRTYQSSLPKASIIVCFYNEHYQTLLRTIHSILNRTPSHLLEEVILVDDQSDVDNIHDDIKNYITQHSLSKVKLFKPDSRQGLIRARLFGFRKAQGEVLIFLDSHIEVNIGWIEPLLDRIRENRTNVAMPIIDIINPDTFAYSSSPLVRGGFNWGLHFKWDNLPRGTLNTKGDFIKPIKSPTMAGGLFAIDKKFFIDIGEYDAGMNIWGGENLEISFRIWMCGGTLELIPCSRVGHIFRHRRPYGSPDGEDTMLYNSLRVAHVWMDDYKDYFLNQRPDAKNKDYGDISSRQQLRKELKCYDFDWYLKNVYPELILPNDNESRLKKKWSAIEQDNFQPWHSRKRNYIDQYQLRMSNSSLCIQSEKDYKTKGSLLVLRPCMRIKNQVWYETDRNELVLGHLLCLQSGKISPILYKCHEMAGDQEWKHKGGKETPIYNLAAGTCLGVEQKAVNAMIQMMLCTDSNLTKWDLVR
nr:polypeptide N-acetylgalactosaminyltransferase 35A-like [Leptinotarsa decemlineata]